MIIGRIMAVAIGLLTGLAGAQTPEFAQQYRQRLGGAIDELRSIVTRFDGTAQAAGASREEAIRRLAENTDPIARGQATTMQEVEARLRRLEAQKRGYDEAGPFGRLLLFVRDADPGLARATYLDYEPAWPATSEGLVAGGSGFVLGWAILLFLARIVHRLNPFRRRRRPSGALRSA
jgi:hypothetical protein